MSAPSSGALFALSDELRLCAYRPEPDFHLPLGLDEPSPWSVLGWTILPAPRREAFDYLVALIRRDGEGASREPSRDTIHIRTSFGRRSVHHGSPRPIDEAPDRFVDAGLPIILRHLGREPASLVRRTIPALSEQLLRVSASHAFSASRNAITVDGLCDAAYVVAFDSTAAECRRVTEIAFDATEGTMRTTLTMEDDVTLAAKGKRLLLLGERDYTLCETRA